MQQAAQLSFDTKEAIITGHENANLTWKIVAWRAIKWVCEKYQEFTTADVDIAMMHWYPMIRTHDKRALGHIVRMAAEEGFCEITDRVVKDPRPNCHQKNSRVWKSKIYKEAQ